MLVILHMRRSRITGFRHSARKAGNLPVELQPCRPDTFSATSPFRKRAMADNRGPWNVFFNGTQVAQIGVFANDNPLDQTSGLSWNIPINL